MEMCPHVAITFPIFLLNTKAVPTGVSQNFKSTSKWRKIRTVVKLAHLTKKQDVNHEKARAEHLARQLNHQVRTRRASPSFRSLRLFRSHREIPS